MTDTVMFDDLSDIYDLMISWKDRLKREKPFFKSVFKRFEVKRVLDVACGTGMHAAAFHDWGYYVTAADISGKMIEKARANVGNRPIEFIQVGFEDVDKIQSMFDAITCLGNSLPNVLTDVELEDCLFAMYNAILPGGILVIHINNYDRIMTLKERFMPLASAVVEKVNYIFVRFFDFRDDDLLNFNLVTLKGASRNWMMKDMSSIQRPLTKNLLADMLTKVGFQNLEFYGGYPDQPFDPIKSEDLIIVAQRPHSLVTKPFPEPVVAINKIPIQENNDPIVDISVEAPEIAVRESPMYARKTVVEMLKQAQSLLPDGYRLFVRIAGRSLDVQRKMYWELYEKISKEHPEWPKSQIRRELNKYLAPPDAKHPPGHTTGGAVDVTIIDPTGKELDMTSTIDGTNDPIKTMPTFCKLITPHAAWNRQLLIDAMGAAGFSNYPGEWWHWSYGDSAWAVRFNIDHAPYGAIESFITEGTKEEKSN